MLVVWSDVVTAGMAAGKLQGRMERIAGVPDGVPYRLNIQVDGKPNPAYPKYGEMGSRR